MRRVLLATLGAVWLSCGPGRPLITWNELERRSAVAAETADAAGDVATLRELAETQGAEAQYRLGRRYAEGRGVPPDPIQAHAWLSLARAQGHEPAAAALERLEAAMSEAELAEAELLLHTWATTLFLQELPR